MRTARKRYQPQQHAASPQFRGERFANETPRPKTSSSNILRLLWNFYFKKPADCEPSGPIPVTPLSREALEQSPDYSLFRLGHSTLLFKIHGKYWLTDPVFSERASPFTWMGPKRFHAPPIALDALPPIEAVILSHNHYDHLDRNAVLALAANTNRFLAPLGVGDTLVRWGIDATKVQQFDWWQDAEIEGIRFTAAPAQHFSGRSLRDGNHTLWCSWAIATEQMRIYFSGDSGYFSGFKTIGERLGPFDITLMETGAYNHQWAYVHMLPEETLQAHLDVKGRWLLPIHNGTFDLAMHAWYDPFERIERLATDNKVQLATPQMGETLNLLAPHRGEAWWRQVQPIRREEKSDQSITE